MAKVSVYKTLFELTEEAVFWYQAADVNEVIKYVSGFSGIRNLDPNEMKKIMDRVCTQYEKRNNEKN